MKHLATYLNHSGIRQAKHIDASTVLFGAYKNCEMHIKKYARDQCLEILIYGLRGRDIRSWAMEKSAEISKMDVGLRQLGGNADKPGNGSRIVVKFATPVVWRANNLGVNAQIKEICVNLESKLLKANILAPKQVAKGV